MLSVDLRLLETLFVARLCTVVLANELANSLLQVQNFTSSIKTVNVQRRHRNCGYALRCGVSVSFFFLLFPSLFCFFFFFTGFLPSRRIDRQNSETEKFFDGQKYTRASYCESASPGANMYNDRKTEWEGFSSCVIRRLTGPILDGLELSGKNELRHRIYIGIWIS